MAVRTKSNTHNVMNCVEIKNQSQKLQVSKRDQVALDASTHITCENQSLSIPFLPSTVPESQPFANHDDQPPSPLQPIIHNVLAAVNKMNSQLDTGNGTQQLSQSIYQSIIQRTKSVGIPPASKICNGDDGERENEQIRKESTNTQHTYKEGDNDHIDLVSSFITPNGETEDVGLQDSEPVDFSPSQCQPKLSQYPESQRFKTPAAAGKKRYHNGDTVETTSLPRNPLRNGEPTPSKLMGLSQAFAGTQAASSPFSNGLPTVPRSDRPSPNINLQTRPATAPSSSPLRTIKSWHQTAAEPSTKYIPMRWSQAERERQAERDLELVPDEDDDFEIDPSQTRRQRREKERELRIRNQLRETSHSSPVQFRGGISSSPIRSRRQTPEVSSDPGAPTEPFHGDGNMTSLFADSNIQKAAAESEAETEQEDIDTMNRGKSYQQQSTGYDDDKENHSIIVQRTAVRLQHAINANTSFVEASPCVRNSYSLPIQLEPRTSSGEAVRIADSQPSPSSSQPSSSPKATADSTTSLFPVAASSPSRTGDRAVEEDQADDDVTSKPNGDQSGRMDVRITLAEDSRGHDSVGAELRSDLGRLELHAAANKITMVLPESIKAKIYQGDDNTNPNSDEASSQPVIRTPPRRRTRRMLDISAECTPVNKTPKFNMEKALELDPDQEMASFLGTSPRQRITYSHKRRRTNVLPARSDNVIASPGNSRDQTFFTAQDSMPSSNDIHNGASQIDLSQPVIRPIRKGRYDYATTAPMQGGQETKSRKSVWDIEASPQNILTPKASSNNRNKQVTKKCPDTRRKSNSNVAEVSPKRTVSITTLNPIVTNALPSDDSVGHNQRTTPTDAVIAPNMVFACFNGKVRAYYPAVCLGLAGSDTKKYQIQWEGYDPDEVDAYGVRKLDLRIGDAVKVNINGFPKVPYVIRGFKDKVTASKNVITDIHGHKTLILAPKQRKSLPAGLTVKSAVEVPVAAVYLDNNMWNQMKSRTFDFMPAAIERGARCTTPSVRTGTPSPPSTRNRRQLGDVAALEVTQQPEGLFSNMIFAMSYEDSVRKHTLMDLVQSQGGKILSDSFHELLQIDEIQLRASFANASFTALLTERHSRKEKYMQALALGLPCLSGRWIEACSRHGVIREWQDYLLPAGESAELDGATKSRILPNMNPCDIKLSHIIKTRPNLLNKAAAVVVVGRGKTELKRAPYVLLVQALGAGKVTKVPDTNAAKDLIKTSSNYKWLFVDDRDVEVTKTLLCSDQTRGKVKKQKRKGDDAQEQTCKVVGNEFIIQSLILGKLFED